ncbi:hypothetical protein HYZ78_01720 [Candidatus Microgenomates bacterium]|nr:hypothetical protein [Candidatus Microgenomates bacterium]
MNKNINLRTILIVITTVMLAIAAIAGAWMLYQTRQQAIAPTAPKEVPAAEPQTTQCQSLTFSLASASTAPSAAPSASASAKPSAAPSSSAAPTTSAAPSSSTAPTSPSIGSSTTAPAATVKPTSTSVAKGSAAASASALPVAGNSLPGIAAAVSGVLLLIFGFLLAF